MTSSDGSMDNSTSTSTPLSRLTRSTDNRVLSGVSGGIGARVGIDPDLVRAAFVVLTFAGGVGAILYGIRAYTEERHLSQDPKYREYQEKVRWKFIPYVW